MAFNSLTFFFFLAATFAAYWFASVFADSKRVHIQNLVLLLASIAFYMSWDCRLLALLILEIAVAYFVAFLLKRNDSRFVSVIAVIFFVGVLGYFKYAGFFVESLRDLMIAIGFNPDWPTLKIVAPIGISFYTFMCLGYVLDVAWKRIEPVKDFLRFFAMMSFFPQIVAGPIGRIASLDPQFIKSRSFDFDFATSGLALIALGLVKKMVIADTLGQYVDKIFAIPSYFDAASCLVAAIFFTIQICCDFSGYSDVARGVARLFGIDLMVNFDRPYLARTFGEFWHRWHISLSTWFRDYVYIPLGGSRTGLARTIVNTWVVFLLSGLWHGAAWTFVVWGGLHAVYLTCGILRKRIFGKPVVSQNVLKQMFDMGVVIVFVSLAWVFFRANSFANLGDFFLTLCKGSWGLPDGRVDGMIFYLMPYCVTGLSVVLGLMPFERLTKSVSSRFAFIAIAIMLIAFIGLPCGGEFIYQRF